MKYILVGLLAFAGCATSGENGRTGITPEGHLAKLGPAASQGGASSQGNPGKTSSLGGSGGYGAGTSGTGGNLGQDGANTSSPEVRDGDLKVLRDRSSMRLND